MKYTYEDEKAEAYLKQGERYFQKGRYAQTLEELSACLKCAISKEAGWIECRAYSILGDLFLFSGYETASMENYLNAKQRAMDRKIIPQAVYAEIKIGLLYDNMGGSQEALWHFDCAVEEARQVSNRIDYQVLADAYIQKAYVLCKIGKYKEAERIRSVVDSIQKIHPGIKITLKQKLLLAHLAKQRNDEQKLTEYIGELLQAVTEEKCRMEYCRFYLDICMFLLECSRKEELKTLLDVLGPVLKETEFISILKQYLKLQLSYDQRFSDKKTYQTTCGRYMEQNDAYAGRLLEFRQLNLKNLKELERIQWERDKYQEKSRRDLTTGLLNKTAMEEEISNYLANRSTQATDALIILDIDDFKHVNDLHGHLAGDAVILRLSQVIKGMYRKDEILGRFGGDEFVVFIKDIKDLEEMEKKLGMLKDRFCAAKFGRDEDLSCTLSVGVSYNQEISTSYEALFECADQALYKAKEYGKNKIAFYEIKAGLLKYL